MTEKYNQLVEIVKETDNCSFQMNYRKRQRDHVVRIRKHLFKSEDIEEAMTKAIAFIEKNRTNVGVTGYRLD